MITVLVVDDHKMLATGIAEQINKYDDIQVVNIINEPKELKDYLACNQVDVLLMDVRMKEYNGLSLAEGIRFSYPEIKIIIMSGYDIGGLCHEKYIDGFCSKDNEINEMVRIIRGVYYDGQKIYPDMNDEVKLTPAELNVLTLISEDLTIKEIAKKTFVSDRTVTNQISSILDKMDVRSRVGAVKKAIKMGLIE